MNRLALLARFMATPSRVSATRLCSSLPSYETLKVTSPREGVVQVELNRPSKSNAMNRAFWREILECFEHLSTDGGCRAVVLSGAGKNFTAGLDLMDFAESFSSSMEGDLARKAFVLRRFIKSYQASFTAIEKCPKPVIAAVHSACIGGGVDMITACDIRVCSGDAWFQVKEVDLGLAADVGTLQRLPKVIGNDSLARELVFTARKLHADEALKVGLVSCVYPDRESLMTGALELASQIASKSPVAVQVSKINLNYSRDHPVDESLDSMANWNMAMLQSEDLLKAVQASMMKETPVFAKL
ncbi:hypothetical protein EMCRGX_G023738 [Ephydatia muelleri]